MARVESTARKPSGGLSTAESLRDSYATWLSEIDWHTFATLTFRSPRSVRRTAELVSRFVSGSADRYSIEVVAWGAEPHASGFGHAHLLVKWHPWMRPDRQAFAFARAWFKRYGRCEVRAYNPDLAAAYYLTKYVLKDMMNVGEWGIWTKGGDREADSVGQSLFGHAIRDGRSGDGEFRLRDSRCWRSQEEVEEDIDEEEEEGRYIQEAEEENRQRRARQERTVR